MTVSVHLAMLLAAAAIVTAPGAAPAATDSTAAGALVELRSGTAYDIDAATDAFSIWIPITITTAVGADEHLEPRVIDVALGDRHDAALLPAFTPSFHATTEKDGPGLRIDVDLKTIPLPGTYKVVLEVRRPATAPDAARQDITLQLTRPAAVLAPIPVVRIDNVDGGSSAAAAATIALRETSRRARLQNVAITQTSATGPDQLPAAGQVFVLAPPIVPAGGQVKLPVTLQGTFPLGTVNGTLEVSAPQLTAPVAVTFEVRTRLNRVWLLVVLGLGLLAGYIVRTVLQARLQLGELRLQGFDVESRLEQERARRLDATFRAAVDTLRSTLQTAIAQASAAQLTAVITAADTGLREALGALDVRRQALRARLDALAYLRTAWVLPAPLTNAIARGKKHLVDAEEALSLDDIAKGDAIAAAAEDELNANLLAAAQPWRQQLRTTLESLLAVHTPALAPFQAELEALRTEVNALALDGPIVAPAELARAVHVVRAKLRQLIERVAASARSAAAAVTTMLDPRDTNASFAPVRAASDDLGRAVAPERPLEDALGEIAAKATALDTALRSAITAAAPESLRTALVPLLDQGRYADAAQQIATQPRAEGTKLGGVAAAPAAGPAGAAAAAPASPPALPAAAAPTRYVRTIETSAPLIARRAMTVKSLLLDKLLQTVAVGALIVAAGFLLFMSTFVGTPSEIGGVFFWAFGIDVTVDSFLRIAKTVPGAAPHS